MGGAAFDTEKNDPNNRFQALGALDANGNNQISSPTVDLRQTSIGTSGVYGNFPSPDDLMNLAPYLADELQSGEKYPALIGQSVLPLAYIFVRKGQLSITNNDILDIRPFFRTAELTYNERSGLAAANPPASLANPVVTNSDLANRLAHIGDLIPKISVSAINVERTEFFPDDYTVFWGKTPDQMNANWEIPGIPDEDKDKVVSVQFRLFPIHSKEDTITTSIVWFRTATKNKSEVARFRLGVTDADSRDGDGFPGPIFNFPVDSIVDPYTGVKKVTITVTAQGDNTDASKQPLIKWYCKVLGYTARDSITPITITY